MKYLIIVSTIICNLLLGGCHLETSHQFDQSHGLRVTSSDKKVQETFQWAQEMALSYVGNATDPVGNWYEASLPERYAFCMRDVSHQSLGAEILGLSKENLNMFSKFAENISESKDWCTYWEINKFNLPAPADYRNDKEFWYNLNANFDVLDACYRTYLWTGDTCYVKDARFLNFYEKSMREYIERWQLQPDQLMNRSQYMNTPQPFNKQDHFHTCRGLPSYVENFPGLTVTADLIACIYRACISYAKIFEINGNTEKAVEYKTLAGLYAHLLETTWWDKEADLYNTFWTETNEFHKGEGETFLLWFGILQNPDRIRSTVNHLLASDWNVENLSYFPQLLYRLSYNQEAYDQMLSLPGMKRSEYPEVSYGLIASIISGMAGIEVDALQNQITTFPHLTSQTEWLQVEQLPVLSGYISIRHESMNESVFQNNTGKAIRWKAVFPGSHTTIKVNGKDKAATIETDILGNTFSFININVKSDEKFTVKLNQ